MAGAPNIATVALLPLAVLLVLYRLEGRLSPRWFVGAFAALLVAQFLTWVETLALATFFGAVALALAYWMFADRREDLRRLALLMGGAYVALGVLVSPFLVAFAFAGHTDPSQVHKTEPADVLSLAVPAFFTGVASGHTKAGAPDYAIGYTYLGIPLIVALAVFVYRYRERRVARYLALCVLAAVVAALGKELHVQGHDTNIPLPWALFAKLPVLHYAIPVRFGVFFLLPAAVALALLLTWTRSAWAWALAGLCALFFVPAVGNAYWKTDLTSPAFFENGASKTLIRDGDRVLAVPTWGESMRWQADEGYRFGLAGGYLGAFPESYSRYPTFNTVLSGRLTPDANAQLRRFVRDKGVTAIVVDERTPGPWRRLFGSLGVRPAQQQGVLVYRLR